MIRTPRQHEAASSLWRVFCMFDYRVYLIDRAGHVVAPARILRCEDDEAAMAEAQRYVDGRTVEVWRGAQHVGVIPPHNEPD
jgi:hypothetical protein